MEKQKVSPALVLAKRGRAGCAAPRGMAPQGGRSARGALRGVAPPPLRFGAQVLLPLAKGRRRGTANRQQRQQRLPPKRPQPLARERPRALAGKELRIRPRAFAQGTSRAPTRGRPLASKSPSAVSSAPCLALAAKRPAKGQLPQPLARKRPRPGSVARAVFGDHVSETEHLRWHAGSR